METEKYTSERDLRRSPEGRTVRPSVTRGPRIDSRELSDENLQSSEIHYGYEESDHNSNDREKYIENNVKEYLQYEDDARQTDTEYGFDHSDGNISKNSATNMNGKRGNHEIGEHHSRSHDRHKSHQRHDGTSDLNFNTETGGKHRHKHNGPDVIVTEADVHSSTDEPEEMDKNESRFYGDDLERHEGQGQTTNSRGERERTQGGVINRKFQSHQNLSRCGESEEERKKSKFQRSASHHYTPQLVRKGTEYSYEIPIDEPVEDELGDLIGSINSGYPGTHGNRKRAASPMQKTTSLADMSENEFTMPQSKMGSFQDFRPLKHSPSTPRVSSSKGRV